MILKGFYLILEYILGLTQIVLGLRFVLKFLNAQETAFVVEAIYSFTDILTSPFDGIFKNISLQYGGVFDVVTLSAMIGYAIGVFVVLKILQAILGK